MHAAGNIRRICSPQAVDDFGNIGKIVARKGDRLWRPVVEQLQVSPMAIDLQIDQFDLMSCPSGRLCNELESQGLETEENFCIQQRARMDG